MKNIQSPTGEHAFSLPVLKAKRIELKASLEEVENAIQAFEKLVKSGVMSNGKASHEPNLFEGNFIEDAFSDLSVYEGTVILLSEQKQALTTDEIVSGLTKGGKKLGKNARVIVYTTLYKAVKKKKNCKIAVAGKSKWKLA